MANGERSQCWGQPGDFLLWALEHHPFPKVEARPSRDTASQSKSPAGPTSTPHDPAPSALPDDRS